MCDLGSWVYSLEVNREWIPGKEGLIYEND